MTDSLSLAPYLADLERIQPFRWTGQVTEVVGLLIESRGPQVAIGDFCEVQTSNGRRIRTQVIGFRNGRVLSMPLEEIDGIQLRDRVIARQDDAQVAVGPDLLNRVLDGFGRPIDRKPPIRPAAHYRLYTAPGSPLDREHIDDRIATGIRAIDTITPRSASRTHSAVFAVLSVAAILTVDTIAAISAAFTARRTLRSLWAAIAHVTLWSLRSARPQITLVTFCK